MIDGLVLTVVGMLTVFAFLVVLVAAMSLLRRVAARWPGSPPATDTAVVAAAVAAIHHRSKDRS
ncbi:MAG: OadG family transporter subunit [bacterium]